MEIWPTSSIESGNLLFSQKDMASMELSSSSCAEFGVPLDMRRVSQGITGVA